MFRDVDPNSATVHGFSKYKYHEAIVNELLSVQTLLRWLETPQVRPEVVY